VGKELVRYLGLGGKENVKHMGTGNAKACEKKGKGTSAEDGLVDRLIGEILKQSNVIDLGGHARG